MKAPAPCVLTLNGGSSSIRFAIYAAAARPRRLLVGKIDRVAAGDQAQAVNSLFRRLEAEPLFSSVAAVGHRVVHGMKRTSPERVTAKLLAALRRIRPYDPDHLPGEIALMEAFVRRHPRLPQVACFDTAFHRALPAVARRMPIPRRLAARGVERYGFHGLSYAYLLEALRRLEPAAARGRVILAHLGSGASLAAVRGGRSIDTTMGFTPASGLMMGTRPGDLDPGLAYFLARTEGMTPARFQRLVNHESGLLGVSGTSADVRDLEARAKRDVRAREAIELFCYQAKKGIGAFAAVLGGLDTLVFSAGIGERDPAIRQRICDGLGFLGLRLDRKRNARNAPVISAPGSAVRVRVIPTDEEFIIARSVVRTLRLGARRRP